MTSAIVLGAGPAGLACAAMLKSRGIPVTILEKGRSLCPVWRKHYDRLHLHTDRAHSSLPGLAMPATYPKYPSRDQVVAYLEAYAAHHRLNPVLGCAAECVTRNGIWRVQTPDGIRTAGIVVVALGLAAFPYRPHWPGLDGFSGHVLHSSEYRSPDRFRGQRVLVVGLGNSGGEIALDLAQAQGHPVPRLSVRGPVNIVPRDICGIPILTLAILERRLPCRLVDMLNRPVLRLVLGDTRRLGLHPPPKGPMTMAVEDGKIPLLDIGTLQALRDGAIALRPGISGIEGATVQFSDGRREDFDAIIQATGFRPDLRGLLPGMDHLFTETGAPRTSGGDSGEKGLFFCSYRPVPTGQLRQIGIEARQIAAAAIA